MLSKQRHAILPPPDGDETVSFCTNILSNFMHGTETPFSFPSSISVIKYNYYLGKVDQNAQQTSKWRIHGQADTFNNDFFEKQKDSSLNVEPFAAATDQPNAGDANESR